MAVIRFDPYTISEQILIDLGVDFDYFLNDKHGIRRQQLILLSKLSPETGVRKNIYKTIHRLEKSPRPSSIDWAANVHNTLVGTVQSVVMETFEQLPKKEKREVIIKWIPSKATRQDLTHSLYYGKIMTLERALQLELGTRYGCQCSFEVVQGEDVFNKAVKKSKKNLFK